MVFQDRLAGCDVHLPVRILYAGIYSCRKNKQYYYAPLHVHPFFQFSVLVRGSLTMSVAGDTQELRAPMMCFIPPFVNHGDVPKPILAVELMQLKFNASPEWSRQLNWRTVQKFYHVPGFRRLVRVWRKNTASSRIKANLELALLLANMMEDRRYRSGCARRPLGDSATPDWLDRVLHYAYEAGENNPTVGQLSQLAGMQPDAFARVFFNATGFHPKYFLMRVKNDKAKEMLSLRRMQCKEIAARLGFKSPEHFTRFFKKFNSMVPIEWLRLSHQKLAQSAQKIDPDSGRFFAGK